MFYLLMIVLDYVGFSQCMQKSKTIQKFITFQKMMENQFSTKIKTLRSDGGGEFISNIFFAITFFLVV